MPNLKQNINGLNKSMKIVPPRSCNCRVKTECPIMETASRNRLFTKRPSRQKIITLPRPTWDSQKIISKLDIQIDKTSFANTNNRNNTELRKYIWYLKENLTEVKVKWRILKHPSSYNPTSNRYNLCLWEKYFVICKPDLASLNKRHINFIV